MNYVAHRPPEDNPTKWQSTFRKGLITPSSASVTAWKWMSAICLREITQLVYIYFT